MPNDLSQLPPPPAGQTGVTLQSLQSLPPPPAGQKGMTLDQVKQSPANQNIPGQSLSEKLWGGLANATKAVGNALTSSEQSFGKDIAGAASAVLPASATGQSGIDEANQAKSNAITTSLHGLQLAQQSGGDTAKWLKMLSSYTGQPVTTMADLYPALKKSNYQVAGDAAGVLLDILSAGSYGEAAKGAESGKLLVKEGGAVEGAAARIGLPTSQKVATTVAADAGKATLSQTLKTIGADTAKKALIGGATGYGYDVANNLQAGKTGLDAATPGAGTAFGAGVPTIIGGVRAGIAVSKEAAPAFINSLIKPKQADFSYGKDPGRTVAELGITGNNLSDLGDNISLHKNDIGQRISEVYANPENVNIRINADDEIAKLDKAIADAAKGGKNNQAIVNSLQNTKDALLYEHAVNGDGVIEKVGTQPRDLSALSPQEVFDLKQEVASHTKFNGTPSDDKTVNSVLKDIYGGLKEKLNTAVGGNNPEITDLNQKYADLTSAELAVKNRDAIVRRADLIGMPVKVGTVAGVLTSLATGGAAIPAVLASVGAATLDKALASTAVKTRVAAWLGSQSPSAISKIIESNPGIRTTLYRLVPKLASQLGHSSSGQ